LKRAIFLCVNKTRTRTRLSSVRVKLCVTDTLPIIMLTRISSPGLDGGSSHSTRSTFRTFNFAFSIHSLLKRRLDSYLPIRYTSSLPYSMLLYHGNKNTSSSSPRIAPTRHETDQATGANIEEHDSHGRLWIPRFCHVDSSHFHVVGWFFER
jgi:hypothetical protein